MVICSFARQNDSVGLGRTSDVRPLGPAMWQGPFLVITKPPRTAALSNGATSGTSFAQIFTGAVSDSSAIFMIMRICKGILDSEHSFSLLLIQLSINLSLILVAPKAVRNIIVLDATILVMDRCKIGRGKSKELCKALHLSFRRRIHRLILCAFFSSSIRVLSFSAPFFR